jgi:hypothetical protein
MKPTFTHLIYNTAMLTLMIMIINWVVIKLIKNNQSLKLNKDTRNFLLKSMVLTACIWLNLSIKNK